MEALSIFVRFILTFILSFAFGLERQMSHKPVGFGAFIFVATGSCGIAILSMIIPTDNPLPILGAIITGVGFLGAGAMMRTGDRVTGATTAAGIWISAIFGLLMGVGQYELALLAYLFVWIVVISDKFMEKRGIGTYRSKVVIYSKKLLEDSELEKEIGAKIYKLDEIDVDRKNRIFTLSYYVEGSKKNVRKIPERIKDKDWFVSVKVEFYGR